MRKWPVKSLVWSEERVAKSICAKKLDLLVNILIRAQSEEKQARRLVWVEGVLGVWSSVEWKVADTNLY